MTVRIAQISETIVSRVRQEEHLGLFALIAWLERHEWMKVQKAAVARADQEHVLARQDILEDALGHKQLVLCANTLAEFVPAAIPAFFDTDHLAEQ